MELLIFKLLASPLLLAAASLAVRRWGATVGGFLIGLPLTSGPVSVFLALERGSEFAVEATSGSLGGTAAQAAFCLAYCRYADKGWPAAVSTASLAYAGVATLLQWSDLSHTWLFLLSIVSLAIAVRLIPKNSTRGNQPMAPWWDLPARMILMAALVVGVTLIAPHIGPGPSGALASFPLMGTILGVFAHRQIGPQAARQVMRGMAVGLFGFAAFFYMVSLTLVPLGYWVSYGIAILCALLLQAAALRSMRRGSVGTGR